MRIKIKKLFFSLVLVCLSSAAYAVPFVNGDFSNTDAWNDASVSGSVTLSGGQAVLETGADFGPYSALMVQGDDGFFSFSSPITLASDVEYLFFDAEFVSLGVDSTESGTSFFLDTLIVQLFDSDDSNFDFVLSMDPDDLFFDPLINANVSGLLTYQLDVSSLAGFDVALSFELNDEDDGLNSRVLIDNVRFQSASVVTTPIPEPSVLALLGVGLLLMRLRFGFRDARNNA